MHSPDDIPQPNDPILVVDDEKIFLSALLQTLQRAGYQAIAHSSPLEALAELHRRKFSVIISDQLMPELSGLELLAKARQMQPFATRILATAVLNLDTVIAAINKGEIFRFIIKPWLHEEFIATLKNAIQRHQLICQNARLQEATQSMNAQLIELNRSLEKQVQLTTRQNQELGQLNAALETNLVRSIELCVHTMQTFYPSLGNQARRVTELCRAIGQIAKLPPDEQRVLESAALLHDIGLVGVPRTHHPPLAGRSGFARRTGTRADPAASDSRPGTRHLRQPPRQGGRDHSRPSRTLRRPRLSRPTRRRKHSMARAAARGAGGVCVLPADGCRRRGKDQDRGQHRL